jgi:hypothetical protein
VLLESTNKASVMAIAHAVSLFFTAIVTTYLLIGLQL